MKKAAFLDRDGVINQEIGEYVFSMDTFSFNSWTIGFLQKLQEKGFLLFIISNQGGIAKGLYSKESVDNLHKEMLLRLKTENIEIQEILYCPHHHEIENCLCRKPGSLMIEKVLAKYKIQAEESFLIGDKETDVQAAEAAGISGIKIRSNQNPEELEVVKASLR